MFDDLTVAKMAVIVNASVIHLSYTGEALGYDRRSGGEKNKQKKTDLSNRFLAT